MSDLASALEVQPTNDNDPPKHWGIVGGGMMGLALAHRLAKDGQRVTILEARPTLGGLADAWRLNDVVWDRHYHVTLLSDSVLRGLLNELDLENEIKWIETKTGFYSGGTFYSMSSTLEFLRFPPLNLVQKLRLGGTIFLASKIKNWRRMETLKVEDWLAKWSGRSTFDQMWLPLLRAKLGNAYQRTSAAFIWSYISRMYKARRTGHKKEMFGYVPGGYARILDTISEKLTAMGVSIQLETQIENIRGDHAGATVSYADGTSVTFDQVVITTPSPVVPKICADLTATEAQLHNNIEYLGIVCASMLLKKPLRGYYVTNITDDVPFTAVIEMSTIVSPDELGGNHLVYLPKYATQDDEIFDRSDEEVRKRFLDTFLGMYPEVNETDIAAFRVSRVRNVMAIPTLSYSEKLPPMKTSVPNVTVINSAFILKGNLNVNETLDLANEAYDEVIAPRLRQSKHQDAL